MNNTPDQETPASPADLHEQECRGHGGVSLGEVVGVLAVVAMLISVVFLILVRRAANELAEPAGVFANYGRCFIENLQRF